MKHSHCRYEIISSQMIICAKLVVSEVPISFVTSNITIRRAIHWFEQINLINKSIVATFYSRGIEQMT